MTLRDRDDPAARPSEETTRQDGSATWGVGGGLAGGGTRGKTVLEKRGEEEEEEEGRFLNLCRKLRIVSADSQTASLTAS